MTPKQLAREAMRTQESVRVIHDAVQRASSWVQPVKREIGRVVVGQERMIERLLIALLGSGHVLLEGVPGLGKALSMRALASAIQAQFGNVRCASDLLPSDLLGSEADGWGPLFSNLVLVEEIDQAPPKARGLLLEAMQERQVMRGHETLPMPDPFLVVATRHPGERDAQLPEAHLDRFMLKVVVPFPSLAEERRILDVADRGGPPILQAVVALDEVRAARRVAQVIHVDEKIKDYIVSLVYATREPMGFGLDLDPHIRHGASPRATLSLVAASRALAFLSGRGYVTPEDVKTVAMDVLRHRVATTYEADAEGITSEFLVSRILDSVNVP